jgi:carboxymethylenebutenolidase
VTTTLDPRLNPHQTYLIEEFADEYHEHHMSRRDMLRRVLLITGSIPLTASSLLALGCGTDDDEDAPAASTPVSTAAAQAPAGTPAAPATPGVSPTDPGIVAADVAFPGPASEMKGYLARPSAAGTYPGVLIIHENRGLNDHTRDVARRYAKEGFAGLAIDLVSRGGGTGTDAAMNTGFLGRANPDELVADLLASVAYLKAQPATQGKALAVTGYCLGGNYAFEVAANSTDIKAAAPYYGSAVRPLEKLATTSAAVLAVYGETDMRITPQAAQVEEKLKASGRPYDIKIYPGAGHSFFNETGGAYNAAAAASAWADTLVWFRRHLG